MRSIIIILISSFIISIKINAAPIVYGGSVVSARFGADLSGIGDFNGDGFDDFAVCAPTDGTGKVFVYFGKSPMVFGVPDITINTGVSEFGSNVSGNFDLNKDGFKDFAVGNVLFNSETGRAYIFFGRKCETTPYTLTTADIMLDGYQTGSRFGSGISGGDVDGDCVDDIIIGATLFRDNTSTSDYSGRVYVFYGDKTSPCTVVTTIPNPVLCSTSSTEPKALFGASISVSDFTNDGIADFVVGAPGEGNVNGHVFLFNGAATLPTAPAKTYFGQFNLNDFGCSVAAIGDYNGNGTKDFAVGDQKADDGSNTFSGKVYLYDGTQIPVCNIFLIPTCQITGNVNGSSFGTDIACLGDFDSDGYNDIITSAGCNDNSGKIYIFKSSVRGSTITPGIGCFNWADFTAPAVADASGTPQDRKYNVAWVGDIDDNGTPDALWSAYGKDIGATFDAGEAYLDLGVFGILSHGNLQITALIQGYTYIYGPASVKVILYDSQCRYVDEKNIKLQANGISLDANGDNFIKFDNLPPKCLNNSYWICIRPMCNSVLETWSANSNVAVTRAAVVSLYNFTTAASQAFMSNQNFNGNKYELYNGNTDDDCKIGVVDLVSVYNDMLILVEGECCIKTDVNGDGFVDVSDLLLVYGNVLSLVDLQTPCSCPCH